MAMIVITVKDTAKGVEVFMQADPQPTEDTFTPAQKVGAIALNAIHAEINRPRIITADLDDLLQ